MHRAVKTFEEFIAEKSDDVNESLKNTINSALNKGAAFAKEVWDSTKREAKETREAVRLLNELSKGNKLSTIELQFLKAQAVDLVKVLPLIAIQGIPLPIPITPFLILLGKRIGFDILPNSHKKVNYTFENKNTKYETI